MQFCKARNKRFALGTCTAKLVDYSYVICFFIVLYSLIDVSFHLFFDVNTQSVLTYKNYHSILFFRWCYSDRAVPNVT